MNLWLFFSLAFDLSLSRRNQKVIKMFSLKAEYMYVVTYLGDEFVALFSLAFDLSLSRRHQKVIKMFSLKAIALIILSILLVNEKSYHLKTYYCREPEKIEATNSGPKLT